MKLYIAGGVYEHGRNCFYISRDNERNVMVDCGVKVGSRDYYPILDEWQIKNTKYLFITHSHNDHCGALQWIIDRGFGGRIISTEETKSQIGIEYPHWTTFSFNEGSDRTTIDVDDISVISGMSGHCIGSVWYKMLVDEKLLLFTGDYCEDTQSYRCSCLRDEFADMAVIDNKGLVVFTGHVYPDTYAAHIMSEGKACKISYPVHMSYNQVADMVEKNHFGLIVMNHSQGRIKDNLNLAAKINERVVDLK